jgi:hypothetical protein
MDTLDGALRARIDELSLDELSLAASQRSGTAAQGSPARDR